MKKFFKVETIKMVLTMANSFQKTKKEQLKVEASIGRILAENINSDINIPNFDRSTMDGYAIKAASSFGSSESNPAYLNLKGEVEMGVLPNFYTGDNEAAKISTGGALPNGADSVIMIEHTSTIDKDTIEIHKSLAPGSNVIYKGEDIKKHDVAVFAGTRIRPQEMGLIAASGKSQIKVFKKPIVGIISTGSEIISANQKPNEGEIRDINSYTLSGQVINSGGIAKTYGIVPDKFESIRQMCILALANSDIVIISGGSSLGTKDLTIDVLESIKDTKILVHGISISPGKPTILAKSGEKQIWGLPGHAASAMIVFRIVVQNFLENISGINRHEQIVPTIKAILNRNISSSQGRVDYIKVKLERKNGTIFAEPIIGKSGLISTMVKAHGLVKVDMNTEGLYKNAPVSVLLL